MLSEEEQVRKDLREWRKQEHAINACIEAKGRMEKQVQILLEFGRTADAQKIDAQIQSLKIDALIANAQKRREKYIKAIEQLSSVDKTIIVDSMINGKSYLRLSHELSYSEASIKWRAKNAIKKICAYIAKENNEKV